MKSTMKYYAYWLHPCGEILPVTTIHIAAVIQDPKRFGYTHERIEGVYTKHKEPMGHEGKAREEIMMDLIMTYGWIRARYTPRADYWTLELHTLSDITMESIRKFFRGIQNDISAYSDLHIIEIINGNLITRHVTTISDCMQSEEKSAVTSHGPSN